MRRIFLPMVLLGALSVILSGCVVRTYRKTQDRVDQDLSEGNRGYLMGTSTEPIDKDRKMTRTTQVVEIELRSPIKFESKGKAAPASEDLSAADTRQDWDYLMEESEEVVIVPQIETYTVAKNDTLQKISMKFYGTTKKWRDIYDANRDILDSPDQIRPGQVLNIPITSVIGMEEIQITAEPIK